MALPTPNKSVNKYLFRSAHVSAQTPCDLQHILHCVAEHISLDGQHHKKLPGKKRTYQPTDCLGVELVIQPLKLEKLSDNLNVNASTNKLFQS